MEQPTRAILNANRGVTNIVPNKTIHTDLKRVTNKLFDMLKNHYGPFSGFAALDNGEPLVETNFTKDGIGILNAVDFASPQEDWVRKTIAYIGSKMENSVGDGTTSAMMFTCAMLRHMSKHLHEIKPVSYNQLVASYKELLDNIAAELDKHYVVKPYEKNRINGEYTDKVDYQSVREIVYHQVYTSSHGNKELAEALADVYSKTPKELWSRMTYEARRQEDDKLFSIVKSEGQFTMSAKIFSTAMLNKELSAEFECDKCILMVMNDNLKMDSPDWDSIWFNMDKLAEDEAVVILCHDRWDDQTYSELNQRLVTYMRQGKRLVIFSQPPEPGAEGNVNDYVALQNLCSDDVLKFRDGNALIVPNVRVHFSHTDSKLSLDNLYQVPDEYKNRLERSIVIDGKHSQILEAIEAWETLADNYAKAKQTPNNHRLATYYARLCVKLKYAKQYTLVIGGKAYDNVAMKTVVDDAIRAASAALIHGITYGNNRSLFNVIDDIIRILDSGDLELRRDQRVLWLAKMIKLALTDISKVVLDRLYPNKKFYWPGQKDDFVKWWRTHSVDLLHYDPTVSWKRQGPECALELGSPKLSLEGYLTHFDCHPITQPANSDIVMLERFGEIALKFILTECIIIAGGAYVENKRK